MLSLQVEEEEGGNTSERSCPGIVSRFRHRGSNSEGQNRNLGVVRQ